MARRVLLTSGGRADIGERLLGAKLQILSGVGTRRPSLALSVLTGRVVEPESILDELCPTEPAPLVEIVKPSRPRLLARTVYLTESHLRDIDVIIQAWQPAGSRRVTRSAVLRRAIEELRATVEAEPAETLLESV